MNTEIDTLWIWEEIGQEKPEPGRFYYMSLEISQEGVEYLAFLLDWWLELGSQFAWLHFKVLHDETVMDLTIGVFTNDALPTYEPVFRWHPVEDSLIES
jgi:hypothetical protein